MRRHLLSVSGLLVVLTSTAHGQQQPTFRAEFSIYRLPEHTSVSTALTEDIGVQAEGGEMTLGGVDFCFFTIADLKIGDVSFKMDRSTATWNGQANPPPDSDIHILGKPEILLCAREKARLNTGGGPLQYMVRRDDGLFEIRTDDELCAGLTIELTITDAEADRMKVRSMVTLLTIAGRQAIDGVELSIGQPIVEISQMAVTLSLAPGRPYGILWGSSHGRLLVIMKISPEESQPAD